MLAAPFGAFGIRIEGESITELCFLPPDSTPIPPVSVLARRAAGQIQAWLEDPTQGFDLPLAARGSDFQRRVWAAIGAIPAGRVRTYGALAAELGSAARAVGQACGANPFPLVVPCHRVVAAGGLGGFAGATEGWLLEAKRWLLAHEARR